VHYLGVKVFNKLPTHIKIEFENPKKLKIGFTEIFIWKFVLLSGWIFWTSKFKYIYIWFGLVFESLAHEVDMHVCSFFF